MTIVTKHGNTSIHENLRIKKLRAMGKTRKLCQSIALLIILLCTTRGNGIMAQNYDESKAGSYTLPPLLKDNEGNKISTIAQWEQVQRPKIVKLFEDNVYGQVPEDFDGICFKKRHEDKEALGGNATLKEVDIEVTRNGQSITIHALLFIPNQTKRPVPAFVVINHRGIKTMDVTRANKDDFWPAEEVTEAGYALVGFDVIDVAPDDKEDFTKEVLQKLYPEQMEMPNGMRALGAWGWGASRVLDYLATDPDIDATRVAVVGHSRGGKAALWCGAKDERFAIAISNESGNSGAKISRRNFGETVKFISDACPYWFVPKYKEYADNEDKLPVDQHMLLALMAPRAVYVASAAEDGWADPKGQYLALYEAQPVFQLYGFKTELSKEMPPIDKQVVSMPLGFHNRAGKHDMILQDWQQFIRFANRFCFD